MNWLVVMYGLGSGAVAASSPVRRIVIQVWGREARNTVVAGEIEKRGFAEHPAEVEQWSYKLECRVLKKE